MRISPFRSRRLVLFGVPALAVLTAAPGRPDSCCRADHETAACALERERAVRTAARIERDWPIAGVSPESDFLRALGGRLAAVADPGPGPWTFTVVHDRRPNAFSIGGGRVYVTDGTIAAADDEAEVAALIAHEMAHDLAGHFCTGTRTPAPSGAPVVTDVDPTREAEADRLSLKLLTAAGYDPSAAIDAAQRIVKGPGGDRRITALRTAVNGFPSGGTRTTRAFEALKHATTDHRTTERATPNDPDAPYYPRETAKGSDPPSPKPGSAGNVAKRRYPPEPN